MKQNSIGERIRVLRELLGHTQNEFAGHIGVSRAVLSQMEIDRSFPTYETLKKIHNAFGINSDYFFDEGMVSPDEYLNSKLGEIHKRIIDSELSKDEQELIIALRELPELIDSFKAFINQFNIEDLEKLSSIGAAWVPGSKITPFDVFKKDIKNEAYRSNIQRLIIHMAEYKGSVIELRKQLIEFLKVVKLLGTVR